MDGFHIAKLDETIHGRVRLGIMAFLSGAGGADFNTLKIHLDTTDGNLSVHMRKLEDAGYVAIDKRIVGRKTLTTVKITREGRAAFRDYLDAIAKLVEQKT